MGEKFKNSKYLIGWEILFAVQYYKIPQGFISVNKWNIISILIFALFGKILSVQAYEG